MAQESFQRLRKAVLVSALTELQAGDTDPEKAQRTMAIARILVWNTRKGNTKKSPSQIALEINPRGRRHQKYGCPWAMGTQKENN